MTFTVASLLVLTFFCLPTSPEMTVGPPLRHLAVLELQSMSVAELLLSSA